MKQFDLQGNEYDCNIEFPKDITDVSFRFSKDVLFKSWQDEALRHREEILQLKSQLQQKENIIKEVREYNEQIIKDTKDFYRPTEDIIYSGDCLIDIATQNLEMLDKERESE